MNSELFEPDSLHKVLLYELPNEGLETSRSLVTAFVFCKLLLTVYLKSEMCFYLFKAENKCLA